MPKLKITFNIGAADAKRLGLDKTRSGDIVDVKQEVADELLQKHWATEAKRTDELNQPAAAQAAPQPASQAPAQPAKVQGVPPTPEIQTSDEDEDEDEDEPDFDAMTKEELQAYAREYGIGGVNMAMAKADMANTIKKAIR